ncbi:MAG: 2-succinyl-5-enolpyruvyl-6-hydroxy-3-cyclohexene-1-carboxylic-acid synthase [Dermabacter sp.]|nr:2-succinyl-5-enolpyruvyl-6-hydroxy-3-cyclohexene-1-carboxylic-acid synthase [Dermabacter sp.]
MRLQDPPRVSSGAVESAYVLLDALRALGLRHLVIAPGSRSAPLVYAAHALQGATEAGHHAHGTTGQGLLLHVRHDERAAAFTALGLSKGGEVAAVVTTSGTAASYLLGAVMEAHHSAIPLVAITADRPAELRGTQANQTTMQPGLFTPFTVANTDLPAATATRATAMELRLAADTAARSWAAAVAGPGPVHINMSFRDPLTPGPAPEVGSSIVGSPTAHVPGADAPITIPVRVGPPAPPPTALTVDSRTLVVAGDANAAAGDMAARFASALNLPLLAEPSSGARTPGAPLVPAYPLALAEVMADPQHPLRPREVVVCGHPTLSRPVIRDLFGARDVLLTVVSDRLDWPDPQRRAERVVTAIDPELSRTSMDESLDGAPDLARKGAPGLAPGGFADGGFTDGWRALGARLHADALAKAPEQARAALAVWDACAEEAASNDHSGQGQGPARLVLGASALIRDLEFLAGPTSAAVFSNRGLAGIDGTVATATGIALAAPGATMHASTSTSTPAPRTRVLLGDVSALHDLTGFILGPGEPEPDLDIVVVDDDGGRIFGGLEHAKAPADMLERFFTTPHGRDLGQVIESLGVPVTRVAASGLREALRSASHSRGRRAFLVQISRQSPGGGD